MVATLIGMTGDWDLAEDCAQEAFAQALKSWPAEGIPRRPGGWLTTVARNRALDRLRRNAVEATKLRDVVVLATAGAGSEQAETIPDDRLQLMFTCCHPALPLEARVALTLRTLAGLSTAEIARAFLVTEATMAKRLVRAKQKIRDAGIPYRVPPVEVLPSRLTGLMAVLYLLFNEGYTFSGAEQVRQNLCAEAIRLARVLAALMPAEPEPTGLLALMLFHDARKPSRVDAEGELVTLEEQDRSRWDAAVIAEANDHLRRALAHGRVGPYQLQAAIAGSHCHAARVEDTDWASIARLYAHLSKVMPTPVVELNRAVAVAMADGPEAGLAIVESIAAGGALAGYHLLAATRADLLRRLGRFAEAAVAYREALSLTTSEAEGKYLRRRLGEVVHPGRSRSS
nr:RNA polymerase sigma factor [Rhizocola hellebori]